MGTSELSNTDFSDAKSGELWALISQVVPADLLHAFGEDIAEALHALYKSWQSHSDEYGSLLKEMNENAAEEFSDLESAAEGAEWFSHFQSLHERHLIELVDRAPGLKNEHRRLLRFVHRQFLSMSDIRNWPGGNAEVLARITETQGESLSSGLELLRKDLFDNIADFHIKRCDESAFEVGKNIAATEGVVVYQNELMQLIHYRPVNKKVTAIPLLFVPPCINKYYILDLTEELSVVRWLLGQGIDLYMISWVNPEATNAEQGMDDYLTLGIEAAKQCVLQRSEADKIHMAGYCIGGLFAALAASKQGAGESIASLTLISTKLDYSEPGELGVFLSERMVSALSTKAQRDSVLNGNLLSWAFTLLREKQLFWPYWVKRYFLNKSLPADPLMYWNQDVSNLSARMTAEYLKSFYRQNCFWEGGCTLEGETLSASNFSSPVYLLACNKDHIVDWKGCLSSASRFSGSTRAVLADGGHVMGILKGLNGQLSGKHWIVEPSSSGEYLRPEQEDGIRGLWWEDWHRWFRTVDDNLASSNTWEALQNSAIEAAPGSYARMKR